jgi:hypothetical protein
VDDIVQTIVEAVNRGSTSRVDTMRILSPMSDEEKVSWLERLRTLVPRKVFNAIFYGAKPGHGEWRKSPSHSEVDYAVVCALVDAGLSDEEIESIFSSFPVGEGCYKNTSRPHHGLSYLETTIRKARQAHERASVAASQARGVNFYIESCTRIEYEEQPMIEMVIVHHEDKSPESVLSRGSARLELQELISANKFIFAVARDRNFVPVLDQKTMNRQNYLSFVDTILRMSKREEAPDAGKKSGIVRAVIESIIGGRTSFMLLDTPKKHEEYSLGWIDFHTRYAYVRGDELVRFVLNNVRIRVNPPDVWSVVRSMGGTEEWIKLEDGVRPLWVVPTPKEIVEGTDT